jgi:hypothetical protein
MGQGRELPLGVLIKNYIGFQYSRKEMIAVAKAEIFSGACGFTTTVTATKQGARCQLSIQSDCKAIQKLAAELTEVDPFREISFKKDMPEALEKGARYCIHAACPVPAGIIKAVEVEAKLNLPVDVTIKVTK